MFEFEDSDLVFEPEALKAIAHEAVEHGTGARGCARSASGSCST